MRRRTPAAALATALAIVSSLIVATACSSNSDGHPLAVASVSASVSSSTPAPSSTAPHKASKAPTTHPPATPTSSATTATPRATAVFSSMTEAQRVGQLFMVDCPSTAVAQATLADMASYGVGSVILDGTSYLSVQQTAEITAALQSNARRGVGLFIATDQEGGQVQRLQGAGFSSIPSALEQGSYPPQLLRADAATWGRQLHAAGVNVDLGPVLDTVPPGSTDNPPIGNLDREYGHTTAVVTAAGLAFAEGLNEAGVDATVKHFPGLGRVTGNTDTTSGVQDTVTTRHDPYLAPFAAAISGGVPFVMVSTAIYTQIDASRPAAFSPTVVTGMLRDDLGFRGVIISDDLGVAKQVEAYSPGQRAIDFIAAGGDIVLTVDPLQIPSMASAVLALTRTSAAFKAEVDSAALVVLQEKQVRGLLG